jgi:hypothetical protein
LRTIVNSITNIYDDDEYLNEFLEKAYVVLNYYSTTLEVCWDTELVRNPGRLIPICFWAAFPDEPAPIPKYSPADAPFTYGIIDGVYEELNEQLFPEINIDDAISGIESIQKAVEAYIKGALCKTAVRARDEVLESVKQKVTDYSSDPAWGNIASTVVNEYTPKVPGSCRERIEQYDGINKYILNLYDLATNFETYKSILTQQIDKVEKFVHESPDYNSVQRYEVGVGTGKVIAFVGSLMIGAGEVKAATSIAELSIRSLTNIAVRTGTKFDAYVFNALTRAEREAVAKAIRETPNEVPNLFPKLFTPLERTAKELLELIVQKHKNLLGNAESKFRIDCNGRDDLINLFFENDDAVKAWNGLFTAPDFIRRNVTILGKADELLAAGFTKVDLDFLSGTVNKLKNRNIPNADLEKLTEYALEARKHTDQYSGLNIETDLFKQIDELASSTKFKNPEDLKQFMSEQQLLQNIADNPGNLEALNEAVRVLKNGDEVLLEGKGVLKGDIVNVTKTESIQYKAFTGTGPSTTTTNLKKAADQFNTEPAAAGYKKIAKLKILESGNPQFSNSVDQLRLKLQQYMDANATNAIGDNLRALDQIRIDNATGLHKFRVENTLVVIVP